MRRCGAIAFLVGIGLSQPGLCQDPWRALTEAVEQDLREAHAPGGAVALVRGDQVVLAKGFGVASVEAPVPVSPQTVFQVGSVTKTLTAAAVLALAEQQHLALTDPIGRRVPGLSKSIAALTLHQLLSQTSGLKDEPAEYGAHDDSALDAYVRSWGDERLLFEPGRYSSASDLSQFAIAFLNDGALEGHIILSRDVISKMAARHAEFPRVFDGEAYGYGLFVDAGRGVTVLGHGGEMPGYSAHLRLIPSSRTGLILLANLEGVRFPRTLGRTLDGLAGAEIGSRAVAATLPISADEANRAAGTYSNRGDMTLVAKAGQLFLSWAGADRPVSKLAEGLYSAPGPRGAPVTFRLLTGPGGVPDCLQIFVWSFRRSDASLSAVAHKRTDQPAHARGHCRGGRGLKSFPVAGAQSLAETPPQWPSGVVKADDAAVSTPCSPSRTNPASPQVRRDVSSDRPDLLVR